MHTCSRRKCSIPLILPMRGVECAILSRSGIIELHDIPTYICMYIHKSVDICELRGRVGQSRGTADEFNQVVSMISHCIGCAATLPVIQYTINSILDFICKTTKRRRQSTRKEKRANQVIKNNMPLKGRRNRISFLHVFHPSFSCSALRGKSQQENQQALTFAMQTRIRRGI